MFPCLLNGLHGYTPLIQTTSCVRPLLSCQSTIANLASTFLSVSVFFPYIIIIIITLIIKEG